MADVGDGDDQPVTAGSFLRPDRIVEVAGVLAVDRDQRQFAQVDPPGTALRVHFAPVLARFAQRFGGEFVRQSMRCDREVDGGVGTATLRQNARDPPDRIAIAARLLDDLRDREIAVLRRANLLRRDHDAMADALVVRHQESDTRLQRESARNLLRAAFQHVDDRALGAAAFIATRHACGSAIAVHQQAHLAIRQEEIIATGVRREKPETVAMPADRADNELQAVDQAILFGAIEQQLPFTDHGAEALGQRLPERALLDAELLGERIECERLAGVTERLQQHFPTRNRLAVALRFFAKARVLILPA